MTIYSFTVLHHHIYRALIHYRIIILPKKRRRDIEGSKIDSDIYIYIYIYALIDRLNDELHSMRWNKLNTHILNEDIAYLDVNYSSKNRCLFSLLKKKKFVGPCLLLQGVDYPHYYNHKKCPSRRDTVPRSIKKKKK